MVRLLLLMQILFPILSDKPSNTVSYYCRAITVSSTKFSSTVSDYPLVVSGTYSYLADTGNGGRVQNASGYDIQFFPSSDCSGTKLDFERVRWVNTSGLVQFVVRIPSASSSSDTVISMRYGEPSVSTDQSNKTGTWASSFKGAYHFENGTTLSATDSTSNAADGSISGPVATTGVLGGAAQFNGTSDVITVTGKYGSPTVTTVEAWVSKDSGTDGVKGGILSIADAVWLRADWTSGLGYRSGYWGAVQPNEMFTNTSIAGAGWKYIAMVTDPGSSAEILYENGSSISSGSAPYGIDYTPATNSTIGKYSTIYFAGKIDEVRVSNAVRSAAYISATYNNINNPGTFYTIGSEVAH